MKRDKHRAAWTALVEGQAPKTNKYHVAPKEERGHYASKHEATVAATLWTMNDRGLITDLQEQVRFTLVEGDGKIRPITFIADFTWQESGFLVVADAKGFKTPVYRLKKKLLKLLHGIEIREL